MNKKINTILSGKYKNNTIFGFLFWVIFTHLWMCENVCVKYHGRMDGRSYGEHNERIEREGDEWI